MAKSILKEMHAVKQEFSTNYFLIFNNKIRIFKKLRTILRKWMLKHDNAEHNINVCIYEMVSI